MENSTSSYKSILKATSLFGGVSVINIVLQVVRSKITALLIGPSGMGLFSLFSSTLDLVSSATSFGIHTSAVKHIAETKASGDDFELNRAINVTRRLAFYTGSLGMLITIIFSQLISQFVFGTSEHIYSLIILSLVPLMTQLSSGYVALLQGLQKLGHLAKAKLLGSLLSTILVFPTYYLLGINGVVPVLIIISLTNLGSSWWFSKKDEKIFERLRIRETILHGKKILSLGSVISLSVLVSMAMSYALRLYVSRVGGVEQLGLFTAGFLILNSYVGLIFNAMAKDYFPRLSSLAGNNSRCLKAINEQAEIGLLVISPIIIFLLIIINKVIILIYTKDFTPIIPMVEWAALGIIFKTVAWSVSYIFLAKGAAKLFFINDLISSTYMLILNLICYRIYGLAGLGISFSISFLIYLLQVSAIAHYLYNFRLSKDLLTIFLTKLILIILALTILRFDSEWCANLPSILVFIISMSFSLFLLNRKANIFAKIKDKF